jgi:hypothetical protein
MHKRLVWLATFALVAASAAAADVYRYTDENGQTFFTDSYYDVPEQYRDQIKDIGADTEASRQFTVVPGFMSPPKGAEGKGQKGKGKGKAAEQSGFAANFEKGFARGFQSATGHPPSDLSPGMLVFGILLTLLVSLAIGGGLLKTACNIVGERPLLLGHAMLVVLIQGIAGALASGALNLTLSIVGKPTPTLAAIGALGGFGATIAVNAGVLKGMHCETWGMALKVTFTVMALGLLLAAPFLYCALR